MKSITLLKASALLGGLLISEAPAAELIANGGFESGLSGWTKTDQLGSEGTFFAQSGTASPVSGFPVPAPPGGIMAAMTDAAAGGSHVLYQDFTVPLLISSATLSFDLFIGNRVEVEPPPPDIPKFYSPDTLDWSTRFLNQQARVDLLIGSADPFSLTIAEMLLKAFQTQPGDEPISGYTHFSIDVTSQLNANLNQTLRLRFAEVDNVGPFQFGVDNVSLVTSLTSPVPEGSAFLPGILTIAGMCWVARKRN